MTNEIKEILDDLDYCKSIERGNILLKHNECDLLLDYITNLQEENKQLRENNLSMQDEMCLRWNEIIDLKDTIQNKNDCIGAYECIIEDRDKRIDKAVEYIENDIDLTGINGFEKLLDILRGDK